MSKHIALVAILLTAAILLSACQLPDALVDGFLPMLSSGPKGIDSNGAPDVVDGLPYATGMPLYDAAWETEAYDMDGAFPDYNTEEYASVRENGFRNVTTSPLSTFSADVDTASYCNLRRMLLDGYAPDSIPSGAVRPEEMINYFTYDYPAPDGDDRFGVTATLAPCPWNPEHALLRVGVRAADAVERASVGSNLVFLIDVSGSMSGERKLPLVKESLKALVDALGREDTLSIVTYSSGEEILIEGANPVEDREALLQVIDGLVASGSTWGEKGLTQAYEVAGRHFRAGGNNRILLCSDGDLNVGITSESDLSDYVSAKRETGIYLSVLGFGDGNYKDTKMETIADDGNGSYYYIDSILEGRRVLVEELTKTLFTAADDVKFQIEFNPVRVSAWRQIGYENRAMADEDFDDDTKDAGEVGCGAQVTVLYELVPAQTDSEEGTDDGGLRYQASAPTDLAYGDEWLTVDVRYKNPGEDESHRLTWTVTGDDETDAPDEDFRFAACVARFAMLLQDSDYNAGDSYDALIEELKNLTLSDVYREEFFSLVVLARRSSKMF